MSELSQRADSRSDEELMAAHARGDRGAFEELFARYAPLVNGLMCGGLRGDEESRDLVQQTFLQLHRARHDFAPGQPLRPWLLTIAYNLRRDHWRRRGRRAETSLEGVPDPVDARTPAAALEGAQRARLLRAALAALPPDQREVIELHWFGGLALQEVAAAVGASVGAVKVRAHRGYKRLRALLERETSARELAVTVSHAERMLD